MRLATSIGMLLVITGTLLPANAVLADGRAGELFQPDPLSVQRYGKGYRFPQAGWIVLHVEGEPYERGYQHGRLLAPEIAAYVRTFALERSTTAPGDAWKIMRTLINALFLRRYDREYLEEMKGIADGAAAAGARFEGRPLDLIDIAALNTQEIETLETALEALPTGLEGMRFPHPQPQAAPAPKPMHCSAFAATGPATVDGKVVIGHITMADLRTAHHCNIWIDLQPTKGHRVLMQSYPGGMQSGLDYYLNDAGLVITETTIAQTRFDVQGMTLASRIRQAIQYADGIDQAVAILKNSNNGLYTNEWIMADMKTNEIAMFELGTARSTLRRSSRNEWFGGTPGFYWGCNNTKDRDVRLETFPALNGRPENPCFCPSDRDKTWVRLYEQHRGKIDAGFGKLAFTTPPIAAHSSVDAKFTTTDLAKELKTWALFGPPLGRSWQPTLEERKRFPDLQALVSNPWTVLHSTPPPSVPGTPLAVDLPDPSKSSLTAAEAEKEVPIRPTRPAWHGTLLPRTDADLWLAAAFPAYERIISGMNALKDESDAERSSRTPSEREPLAVETNVYRSGALAGARAAGDIPLAQTRPAVGQSHWYNVATGKGVLLLQDLAQRLGKDRFIKAMDSFGREHAGQEVTAEQFQAHVERAAGQSLREFFDFWLHRPGLPSLRLENATIGSDGRGYQVNGELLRQHGPLPQKVELTVETEQGEESTILSLHAERTPFAIRTQHKPLRLVVDKYLGSARTNGGVYTILTWHDELEKTLIVYGTRDEQATNREAAEELQQTIIRRHSNYTVPIRADREISDEEIRSHHLLLIGRPDCNVVVERLKRALPLTFGRRSFLLGREAYAHARTAVLVVGENPEQARYSIVVIAGLSPEATILAASQFLEKASRGAEALVLPRGGKARSLVLPPAELVKDFRQNGSAVARQP